MVVQTSGDDQWMDCKALVYVAWFVTTREELLP